MAKKSRKKKSKSSFLSIPTKDFRLIGILIGIFIFTILYFTFLSDNVSIKSDTYHVYIPANCSNEKLADILKKEEVISNAFSFKMVANWLSLQERTKGGMCEIKNGWGNFMLVQHLKVAELRPVKVLTITSYRRRNRMVSAIQSQLKFDKKKFQAVLEDERYLKKLGLTKESVYCLFMPGTYYLPDSLNEREFIEVMKGEFEHFFTEDKRDRMDDANLSTLETYILASIVYSETKSYDEMPTIAGVYINRLKKNMKLEADPTIVYASQDFGARRVYKKKKYIYPEYNTYDVKGLPPGPIHFPPPKVVDLVLQYEDHDYIFFCAKPDGSGTHDFAETFNEHKSNADKFREWLKKRKIF